jgi:hypothetical protein
VYSSYALQPITIQFESTFIFLPLTLRRCSPASPHIDVNNPKAAPIPGALRIGFRGAVPATGDGTRERLIGQINRA